MKKLLLTSALAVLATLSSYGQGSVNFANASATAVTLADGTRVPVGTRFLAELMYAPDLGGAIPPEAAFDAVATRVGATSSFGGSAQVLPGIFQGGGRTVSSISPSGGFGLFQVRVWESGAGASWSEAMAGGNANYQAGHSAILRVDTGDPTLVPAQTPAALTGLTAFQLQPIPEPSVIGLGLLGAGALLMLRRRK